MGKCHSCCRELRHLDSCQDGHELIYYDAGEHEAFSYCPLCEVLARVQEGLDRMARDKQSLQLLLGRTGALAEPMCYPAKEEPSYTRADIERAVRTGLAVSATIHGELLGNSIVTPGMFPRAIDAFDSGWGKES